MLKEVIIMINKGIFRIFFESNKDWINSHNLLDTNDLKIFYDMYEKFINDNNITNDEEVNAFRVVIRNEILKSLERKNTIIRVMSLCKAPSNSYVYIVNPTINEWYLNSRVQYVVEKSDLMILNSTITPKIKQNRKEMASSYIDASRKIVK